MKPAQRDGVAWRPSARCSTISPWAWVNVTGVGTGSGRCPPSRTPCLRIGNLRSVSCSGMAVGSSTARHGCDGSWSSSPCFRRGRCRTGRSCSSLVSCSFCWVVLLRGLSSPEADRLFLSALSQLGTFKSDDGDYFVEPLLSLEEQEYEEEHNKPHLVYRHRTPPTNSSGDRQTCDTPGIRFLTALDDLALRKGN